MYYDFDYIKTVEEANKELKNLPDNFGGSLYLNGLASAEGLKLPETIGYSLSLDGLTSVEKEKLKNKYPKIKIY